MSSLSYDLTLAGLAVGSAAALTGIGLIVTYRATGVLNFAHGAVAMVCAYVLRQLATGWHWPLPLAAAVTLLLVAPGIGIALDRAVFRPLAVGAAGPARTLVASLGVFVLLVGGAGLLWGPGARADAPALLPDDPWVQLGTAVTLAAGVAAVTRWTRFGRELRAVVDNRPLAVLGGIDADRVAAAGWAFGTFTAGLTGILLAPLLRLDPYGLPLLVMEVMAVAVAAGLRSLPVAVAVALGIGVAQSQLTRLHPGGSLEPLVQAVGANLFVVALLVAAPALRGLGPARTPAAASDGGGAALRTGPLPDHDGRAWLVGGILFLLPLGFAGGDLRTAVQVPALGVVLLSLVVVTGRGGQLSLGQAAYAGLGALFTALLAAGRFPGVPAVPGLLALLLAVLLTAPLGLLTGRPALRGHGLATALATLAFGVAVSRFVFDQPYATAGLTLDRPAGFTADRAYYVLELVLLGLALLAVAALRRGRTGRALAAMRDHEPGAAAAGVPVPALKLAAFVVGAALAALGGGMLGMALRTFDAASYDPVRGLLWFAAVVVLGADSLLGALTAAVLLVGLDAGAAGGAAAAVIGVLAVLAGRLPHGPYAALRGAAARVFAAPEVRLTPLGARVRERLAVVRGPLRTDAEGPTSESRAPDPHLPEPRAPEPRAPEPSTPEPRAPEPRAPEPRAPEPRTFEPSVPDLRHPLPHTAPSPVSPAPSGRRAPSGRLTARAVRARYDGFTALDGVDLTVAPGRITALIGPNGAGKSTLFHCLCGTLRPAGGRVLLDGADITRRSAHARARLGLARTFQQLAVFEGLNVAENVRVGAEQSGVRDPAAATARALDLFSLDGQLRTAPVAGLDTGTLRRVELARAVAGRPRTLLLDEPAAGLDSAEVSALADVLRTLAADGTALLVVEHDLDLVAGLADTVYAMAAGRIVARGPAHSVLAEPGETAGPTEPGKAAGPAEPGT
ncbi:ATP-binding cassette domain-containing protein [Streptomyces albofaciens JCM 4342]|uniref:ABC transporter permease subunit n=1 Tax=Streptomyces albofaciens TaxID=66866 RepID=UPI001238A79D|nr:ATP-binding cassette domain-containing protein [Streptomyces albofaciens]KAA6222719.1 ATP-binding cassette domain-containing protein [Streptomyces albofaciens JCM 4342]